MPDPVATTTPAAATPPATPDKAIVSTAIARLTGKKAEAPSNEPPKEETKTTPAADPKAEAAPAPGNAAASAATPEAKETKPKEGAADRIKKVAAATPPPAPAAIDPKEIARATVDEVTRRQEEQRRQQEGERKDPVLQPEDQQELELARYAATKKKERYAELPDKMLNFFKKRDELLTAKAQELGGAEAPEFREFLEGEEYKNFVRAHRPSFQRGDRVDLERQRIKDDADAEANKKIEAAKRELDRKIDEMRLTPVIEKEVNEAISDLFTIEDEVVKSYAADPEKALQECKIEAREVEDTARGLHVAINEYLRIDHGLVDPKPGNPLHDFLDTFITQQGKMLDAKPEEERRRKDGTILVSPMRLAELEAAGKSKGYATFSRDEVVRQLVTFTKLTLPGRLEAIRKDLEASGYERKPRAAATDATKPKEETPPVSPKAGASRAPGPSDKPAGGSTPRHVSLLTGRK